jgi:hypothetical protein
MRGPAYSTDEWILMFEYFVDHDTPEHDKRHPVLIKFAEEEIGRPANSVGMQLLTIHAYLKGPGLSHGGSEMKKVVDAYQADTPALKIAAADARRRLNKQ